MTTARFLVLSNRCYKQAGGAHHISRQEHSTCKSTRDSSEHSLEPKKGMLRGSAEKLRGT